MQDFTERQILKPEQRSYLHVTPKYERKLLLLLCLAFCFGLILGRSLSATSKSALSLCLEEEFTTEKNKRKAALILYGVPKHFEPILKGYNHMLMKPNSEIFTFEIFMHMYEDLSIYSNPRNKEFNVSTSTALDVRSILSQYPYPFKLITSKQLDFDKNLAWIDEKDYAKGFRDWTNETIRNRFRADNSLALAYAQARDSGDFSMYFLARADTLLISMTKLPENWNSYDVILPGYARWRGYSFNDRFAICSAKAAGIYSSRADWYKEYMQTHEYPANSESMLRLWILKNNLTVFENEEPYWANLLRIRANGNTDFMDWSEFASKERLPVKNIEQGSKIFDD